MASSLHQNLSVRDLRRRWKPTKERLAKTGVSHPLSIRLHRAFSWMAAVEEMPVRQHQDQVLLFLWIAFNALYGRWDSSRQSPEPDAQGMKSFLESLEKIDKDHLVDECIQENETLAYELLTDQYLSKQYWRSLDLDTSFSSKKSEIIAQRLFSQKQFDLILRELIERIYFNRCQLFHGAATFESDLNRESLARSADMLDRLLRAILIAIIDHGMFESWDGLCFPPTSEPSNRFEPMVKRPR